LQTPDFGDIRINESGFKYTVNPSLDSVKKVRSINESEYGFGFDESCLNPVSLAT